MRVYFIGSHSSGKTTLARYVKDKYNLPMITEVARAILSEKELHLDSLRTNLDVVDDYQSQIFWRQLEEESKYSDFVSDRSFDCLAYAAQHSRVLKKLIESNELAEYIDTIQKDDATIFFVRPNRATLKDDGIRESLSWDGVVQIDSMIKFMLQMWNIKHFQISMDSMQERTHFIDAVLTTPLR